MKLAPLLVALVLGVAASFSSAGHAETKAQRQTQAREMANKTLSRLYAVQPTAEAAIQDAAGYAVFSNFGMKILLYAKRR